MSAPALIFRPASRSRCGAGSDVGSAASHPHPGRGHSAEGGPGELFLGKKSILNRKGLEGAACECDRTIRKECERPGVM